MRKLVLLLASILVLVLVVVFYPRFVEKPVKDGIGPLAVYLDPQLPAPEYHSPLEWWQTHHFETVGLATDVNRGDLEQADCLYCHQPETSCNNCHGYVGANPIVDTTWAGQVSQPSH